MDCVYDQLATGPKLRSPWSGTALPVELMAAFCRRSDKAGLLVRPEAQQSIMV